MIWNGAPTGSGYGNYQTAKGVNRSTHKLAYLLSKGDVGSNFVLHKCDTKRCCNPEHLFLGTQDTNMKDKVAKNRQARGEQHGKFKFDKEVVDRVRFLSRMGKGAGEISTLTGVSQTHVKRIRRTV